MRALPSPWATVAPPVPSPRPPGSVPVRTVVQAARRRLGLIAAILVACLVAGVVYLRVTQPTYQAVAQLLIDAEVPKAMTFSDIAAVESARPEYLQTQYEVLRSRSLAARTIETLQLWNHAELTKRRPPAGTPASQAADARRSAAVTAFLSRLSVSPHPNSRVVDVTWRSVDPALAARVVNALVAAYIAETLDYRSGASRETAGHLQKQLQEQRLRVQSSEAALQNFLERQDVVKGAAGDTVGIQRLGEIGAAATRARAERIAKQARYEQLASIAESREGLDSAPDVLANPFVQSLKTELSTLQRKQAEASERLGDEHPDMVGLRASIRSVESRLDGELHKLLESARNDYLAAQAEERGLEGALVTQKRSALVEGRKTLASDVLERNLASDRRLFEALLQRVKESEVASELRATNIRVLDQAEVPLAPLWPSTSVVLALAGLLGVAISTLVVGVLEVLDDRVRTPDEVGVRLGLRPVGLVPVLPTADIWTKGRLLAKNSPSRLDEAFSFVRANAISLADASGTRQLVVTSAAPGDGKTTVAMSLAAALSDAGDKVAFIDGDMRSPDVHRLCGVPCIPGLSDTLSGEATPEVSLHPTSNPALWVLPAGSPTARPSILLASDAFRELLVTLAQSFDWIIVDSPPTGAVADACAIARAGCSVLFVVGANRTSRRAAESALEQLAASGATVVGAVVNRIDSVVETYPYGRTVSTH